ncbi:hypothetical protein JOD54_005490 [Actinokineospora baliensis]|nr:hypothetical protein [Actinokineospora baliensis]
MGRTCFARGPCASRGRTAKLGPKSMALSAHNATTAATPRKTSPPHRAVTFSPRAGPPDPASEPARPTQPPESAAPAPPLLSEAARPNCSMGRTCFARGPCTSRGRTAKLGPKSMALSAQNATTAATPRKTSPPHRAAAPSPSSWPAQTSPPSWPAWPSLPSQPAQPAPRAGPPNPTQPPSQPAQPSPRASPPNSAPRAHPASPATAPGGRPHALLDGVDLFCVGVRHP